jgi:hypothetical protein
MEDAEIKAVVKVDLAGVMAISHEEYGKYLDDMASSCNRTRDEMKVLVTEALRELPPGDEWW